MNESGNPQLSQSEIDNDGSSTLQNNTPLSYQETPIIDPTPPPEPIQEQPANEYSYTQPPSSSSFGTILKAIIGFIILFIVGYVASGYIRQYLAGRPSTQKDVATDTGIPQETIVPTLRQTGSTISGQLEIQRTMSTPSASTAWKSYKALNGATRQPLASMTFQLPATVLAPVCDGSTCASQGTYLPGGTRFTVAPRGPNQVLSDYRNKIISDLSGKAFTVKETTIQGKKAVEFSGNFVGSTVGGYAFSRMRGYMIEISDTESLEINHFIPSGITADFAGDDVMFDSIIKTFVFTATGGLSGTMIPTINLTATIAP